MDEPVSGIDLLAVALPVLLGLSDCDREVFVDRYVRGLSEQQVADEHGRSRGWVGLRSRVGRDLLHAHLFPLAA